MLGSCFFCRRAFVVFYNLLGATGHLEEGLNWKDPET